jgi:hypothetical protein
MGFPAFNLTLDQLAGADDFRESELSGSAIVDLARWRRLPAPLRDRLFAQMRDYQPPTERGLDGPCDWLDMQTRQCRHHEHRPQVCRDFRVGGSGCLQWRNEFPQFRG